MYGFHKFSGLEQSNHWPDTGILDFLAQYGVMTILTSTITDAGQNAFTCNQAVDKRNHFFLK